LGSEDGEQAASTVARDNETANARGRSFMEGFQGKYKTGSVGAAEAPGKGQRSLVAAGIRAPVGKPS
jgi:hypothetical protein